MYQQLFNKSDSYDSTLVLTPGLSVEKSNYDLCFGMVWTDFSYVRVSRSHEICTKCIFDMPHSISMS